MTTPTPSSTTPPKPTSSPTPKPTPTVSASPSISMPTINWGASSEQATGGKQVGVQLGFGTDRYLISAGAKRYITSLVTQNPKLYAKIRNAVKQATGKTYNDPDLLGAWIEKTVENLNNSIEPNAKKVSVEDLLRGAAALKISTSTEKPNIPTRQVYQTSPETIAENIDTLAGNVLKRSITDADKKEDWYKNLTKSINDMVSQGIVTTSKVVKNPKTGQMETLVTQAPGFSKEQIAAKTTKALETADPESFARSQRIDFTKWLYGQMGFSG